MQLQQHKGSSCSSCSLLQVNSEAAQVEKCMKIIYPSMKVNILNFVHMSTLYRNLAGNYGLPGLYSC